MRAWSECAARRARRVRSAGVSDTSTPVAASKHHRAARGSASTSHVAGRQWVEPVSSRPSVTDRAHRGRVVHAAGCSVPGALAGPRLSSVVRTVATQSCGDAPVVEGHGASETGPVEVDEQTRSGTPGVPRGPSPGASESGIGAGGLSTSPMPNRLGSPTDGSPNDDSKVRRTATHWARHRQAAAGTSAAVRHQHGLTRWRDRRWKTRRQRPRRLLPRVLPDCPARRWAVLHLRAGVLPARAGVLPVLPGLLPAVCGAAVATTAAALLTRHRSATACAA